MKKQTIGTIVIAYNEAENIEKCLRSVKSFSDELVVVIDPRTNDDTKSIAHSCGAKIYKRQFDSMDGQKTYAESKLTTDWVFSLDADETVTKELQGEIPDVIRSSKHDGYLIPRRNIILKKEIKHSRWAPDKHIWLWKRGKGRWTPGIHAEVEVDGVVGELTGAKMHYQYETVREFLDMVNKYSSEEAKQMSADGISFSLFRLFFAPALSFFRRYVYKRGFLDGWRGLVLAILMGYYRWLTWVKIWKLQSAKNSQLIDDV